MITEIIQALAGPEVAQTIMTPEFTQSLVTPELVKQVEVAQMYTQAAKYIAIGIMCTLPFALVAIAEGWVAARAMEAMGRNPEAGDSIFTRMVVAMAICESTAIYTLVVTLIMLFVLK